MRRTSPRTPRPDDPPKARAEDAVELWIRRNIRCGELGRKIRRSQAKIRDAVPRKVWLEVLHLEEQINARHLVIVAAAIRLALREAPGRKLPKKPRTRTSANRRSAARAPKKRRG